LTLKRDTEGSPFVRAFAALAPGFSSDPFFGSALRQAAAIFPAA
jgi:hypothetical protein